MRLPRFSFAAVCVTLSFGCGPDAPSAQEQADARSWLERGAAHREAGRWLEAERAFATSVELDDALADGHLQLGVARLQRSVVQLGAISVDRELLATALAAIDRAIELDPANPEGYYHRGVALERQLRFDAAEAAYAAVLERAPTNVGAQIRLGVTRLRGGRYELAREALQTALGLDPRRPDAHYQLGIVQQELGEWAPSLESFDRAVALYPAHAQAHFARSNSLRRLGRSADADAALAEFRRLSGVGS